MNTLRIITLCTSSPFEIRVGKADGARIWKDFLNHGSNHSSRASLLPYIIRRCEAEGVPYQLKAVPGAGYWIEPIKPDIEKKKGKTK